MSKPIIEIKGLGKKYYIGANREGYLSLRDELAKKAHGVYHRFMVKHHQIPSTEEFWALKDVSFEVNEGDAIGIIGRNGAGKSTLLKILSQITPPTEGQITARGRVASLLEVGTGFHPELTGRENIFLNGTILGMRRNEIKKKFDEIVDFAEVEKFLDTPVKRYSSGMYVRLAFAVAAHLEPEILIVDEVLAVGDSQFQKKCLGKMNDVVKSGRTVIFVSHNIAAVTALCDRAVYLDAGRLCWNGSVEEGIRFYLNSIGNNMTILDNARKPIGSGDIVITSVFASDDSGVTVAATMCGDDVCINISYICKTNNISSSFAVDIYNSTGQRIAYCNSIYTTGEYINNLGSNGIVSCRFTKLPLTPGQYRVDVAVHNNGTRSDYVQGALMLTVIEGNFYSSGKIPLGGATAIILLNHNWIVNN